MQGLPDNILATEPSLLPPQLTTAELSTEARHCLPDELPDVGRQWAMLIDANTTWPGEPRNYTDRVLRMLGAVEPHVLPHTVRELGTLLLRDGESEAWSANRRNLRSFLGSLTAEMLETIDSGPPRVWWAQKAMADQRAAQTAQYLRKSFRAHMEERAWLIEVSNEEIQARLQVLQQTPLLGPVDSLQPRLAIDKALDDCRRDHRRHYLGTPTLSKMQPDILAKVLTVRLTADKEKRQEMSELLALFRMLPDGIKGGGIAQDPTTGGEAQLPPPTYGHIRDRLVCLYQGAVFGDTLPTGSHRALTDNPRYQEIHNNLTLAADWLLLHEQLERAQTPHVL